MEGVPSSRDYEGGFGAALMLKVRESVCCMLGIPVIQGSRGTAMSCDVMAIYLNNDDRWRYWRQW